MKALVAASANILTLMIKAKILAKKFQTCQIKLRRLVTKLVHRLASKIITFYALGYFSLSTIITDQKYLYKFVYSPNNNIKLRIWLTIQAYNNKEHSH